MQKQNDKPDSATRIIDSLVHRHHSSEWTSINGKLTAKVIGVLAGFEATCISFSEQAQFTDTLYLVSLTSLTMATVGCAARGYVASRERDSLYNQILQYNGIARS